MTMISNPVEVRKELIKRVLRGGDPYYSYESACDNGGVDWTVLDEQEFLRLCKEASVLRSKSTTVVPPRSR